MKILIYSDRFIDGCILEPALKCTAVQSVIIFSLMCQRIIIIWEDDMVSESYFIRTSMSKHSFFYFFPRSRHSRCQTKSHPCRAQRKWVFFEKKNSFEWLSDIEDLKICFSSRQAICLWTMWKGFSGKKLTESTFRGPFGYSTIPVRFVSKSVSQFKILNRIVHRLKRNTHYFTDLKINTT